MIDLNNLCDMINSNCKKFKIVGNSWYQEMVFQFSDIHTSWYVTHIIVLYVTNLDQVLGGMRWLKSIPLFVIHTNVV
jgi:hypothetical protein